MIRYLRELRLLPIAVVACACLLTLIAADLLLDDGSSVGGNAVDADRSVTRTTPAISPPTSSMKSWASQMFNFPDGSGAPPSQAPMVAAVPADRTDITGSVLETPEKVAKGDAKTTPDGKTQDAKAPNAKAPQTTPMGTAIPLDGQPSGAERAILERLQERRQELDARARELDIRESLIQAAEKRMDGQLAELKETEQRIKAATQQRDDADAARFKGLVTMYETMKPRDAAKIFDRLDIGVLIEMASKIKPQAMADIMAQMSPDNAQRLTVELASKAQDGRQASGNPIELPKIQGQPTGR